MKNFHVVCLILGLSLGASAQPLDPGPVCSSSQVPAALSQGLRKVGEEVILRFESPHPYATQRPTTSGALHVDVITDPGATYIAPHFAELDLEEGDYVLVRSPDGSRSWRYDNSHPGARDGFWGIHIAGDTAIIELHGTSNGRRGVLNKYGYRIDKYARGYPIDPQGAAMADTEALCGVDNSGWARCYQTSEPQIYNHSRAVARLLIEGTSACTGWLVGNQGHLLTNNHCISTSSSALNTNYEFMAEGSTCSTACSSWGACPGTVVASGATLISTNAPRDYTLLQLPTNPTGTYGYLQLRPSGAAVNERIYVPQHPQAWGKKIAVTSTAASDESGYAEVYSLNEAACQAGGPADVGYFADTQGGSSGSPVIAYGDHQVVALHHCANCPNRGVPIQEIISHLGASLPSCALRSSSCPDPFGSSIPSAGLKMWLRADAGVVQSGGRVSSWQDQSGNGNHATMTASSRQPYYVTGALNSKPVIRFNGAESLYFTSILRMSQSTVFVVAKNNKSTETFNMILGPGGNSANHQLRFENSSNALLVTPNVYTSPIGNTRVYLALATRYNGSTWSVFRDGVLKSTHGPSSGAWELNQVGAWYSSYFMQGDVAEVIAYDRALSESERATVNSYLRSKYALP